MNRMEIETDVYYGEIAIDQKQYHFYHVHLGKLFGSINLLYIIFIGRHI